jgi:3-hydroxyisobutyrate dehydrogenase-like beta-hydroxyacid dehydrogenase
MARPEGVAAGTAGIFVSGAPEAVDKCRPLFQVLGRRTFEGGTDPEAASAMKIANNFMLGCAIEAMGEAFALTRKYGVPPSVLYDVISDGLFNCIAYKGYGKIIVDQSYDKVGQMAELGLKDANLALQAANLVMVPMPSCNVWRDRLIGAIAHGDGDKDWAVMAREQARASGLA